MGPSRSTTDYLVRAAALVVILAGLKLATPLVVPILLASFIAMVSAPLMFWFTRRGVNRYVAVMGALSADVAFFAAMVALAASGLNAIVGSMPRYQERIEVVRGEASAWLMKQNVPGLGELVPAALRYDDVSVAIAEALGHLARTLSSLLLVLLLVAFLLVEMLGIEDKLRVIFRHPELGIEQFRRAAMHVQRYIVVKTAANALTGLLVWVWLAAFRVDFALLWAVCAFMLAYIPTLGSVFVGVPVLIVTVLQYGFGTAVIVGTGYALINTAIAALVEPRVFGQALGLSPLVVFISMVCWGWLWGPVGAVLSVPLTVVVKIALAYVEGYEWLSKMLGPVTGSSGVGTPSIPPGVLTSMPPNLSAGISLGAHSVSITTGTGSAVMPGMAPMSGMSAMAPIVPATPPRTFNMPSSMPPPPRSDDDVFE